MVTNLQKLQKKVYRNLYNRISTTNTQKLKKKDLEPTLDSFLFLLEG